MTLLTHLETTAIDAIRKEWPEFAAPLAAQLATAAVISRELTPGGLFTTFAVAEAVPLLPFGSPTAEVAFGSLKHGIGFHIEQEAGRLTLLEDALYGEELIGSDFEQAARLA